MSYFDGLKITNEGPSDLLAQLGIGRWDLFSIKHEGMIVQWMLQHNAMVEAYVWSPDINSLEWVLFADDKFDEFVLLLDERPDSKQEFEQAVFNIASGDIACDMELF